ncbi:hypothetical protein Q428_14670 [Fervidicella metallireducens AeB]|uniref:DUF1871 domain-containing protein n=1 Tax=Fervidicella metallireducens AeB TaxID=1403537 RepID=A0A017RR10_9CLOT|nr:DUF1871 family protein [Fervidicella metallireducens]EYE87193.1 hypothetical protein Q428_14670 [Fervidicella metallireducens AeB]
MSIKKIIDKWDPIDLLSHAPDDEYHSEISEIGELLKTSSNDLELIADGIYTVFSKSFRGEFSKTKDECKEIAKLILMDINR